MIAIRNWMLEATRQSGNVLNAHELAEVAADQFELDADVARSPELIACAALAIARASGLAF